MLSTKQAEGLRLTAYNDSLGYKTVGYGHLLDDSARSKATIESAGADYNAIKSGTASLTPEQANHIFDVDNAQAGADLHRIVPDVGNFPKPVQAILQDMTFNLGAKKLANFAPTIQLMRQGQFATAAAHLKATPWYRQTGERSQAIVQDLLNLGNQ